MVVALRGLEEMVDRIVHETTVVVVVGDRHQTEQDV